ALYMFPKLDLEMYRIESDEQFAYDLLRARKLLVTQGTGFNLSSHDHFRLVTLPPVEVIADAVDRIGDFLATIRRGGAFRSRVGARARRRPVSAVRPGRARAPGHRPRARRRRLR